MPTIQEVLREMKYRIHNESLKLPIKTGHTRNWFRNSFIFDVKKYSIALYFDASQLFTVVPYAEKLLATQRFVNVKIFDNIRHSKSGILEVALSDIGFSMAGVENHGNVAMIKYEMI